MRLRIKARSSGGQFKSPIYHIPAVWLRTSLPASLGLSFSICKMEMPPMRPFLGSARQLTGMKILEHHVSLDLLAVDVRGDGASVTSWPLTLLSDACVIRCPTGHPSQPCPRLQGVPGSRRR